MVLILEYFNFDVISFGYVSSRNLVALCLYPSVLIGKIRLAVCIRVLFSKLKQFIYLFILGIIVLAAYTIFFFFMMELTMPVFLFFLDMVRFGSPLH